MPVRWTLDGDEILIEVSGTAYEPPDVVQAFHAALDDPACPPEVSVILDVTHSERLAARPVDEIRMVAKYLGPFAKRVRGRCAVVANSDVHFGLSQMGASYSQSVGIDARVFRSLAEARAWLAEEQATPS